MTTVEPVIGQTEAMRVLEAVSPAHVLLIGTPGMGKTHIAKWYAHLVSPADSIIIQGEMLADNPLRDITIDGTTNIAEFKGTVIVDECHVAKNHEAFYPILDKRPVPGGKDWSRTFIFTTTDEGKLPPALLSRLVVISLKQYSLQELADIAGTAVMEFPNSVRLEVARLCHGSPRRAKVIAGLLQEVGRKNSRRIVAEEVRGIMRYLGYPEGLYDRELEIMRALVGTTRSLNTLSALLATSRDTIGYWETGLIAAGLMTISPRGRALTDDGRVVLQRVDGKVESTERVKV